MQVMKESQSACDRLSDEMALSNEVVGIGWLLADLHILGIDCLDDFRGIDPNGLFVRWKLSTHKDNPLALCIFRCAVYLADTPTELRDPRLTKWWYWA